MYQEKVFAQNEALGGHRKTHLFYHYSDNARSRFSICRVHAHFLVGGIVTYRKKNVCFVVRDFDATLSVDRTETCFDKARRDFGNGGEFVNSVTY